MKLFYFLLLLSSISASSQEKGVNTIKVSGIGFLQVCNALLDAGYMIERKDNDLQTAKTEFKEGVGKNNHMKLSLLIHVRDSIVTITGLWYNSLFIGSKLFGQEQTIENSTSRIENTSGNNKNCFKEMNRFALSLNKPIEYLKQ